MIQVDMQVRKEGYYLCRECSLTFCYVKGELSCPCCSAIDKIDDPLIIFVDEDSDLSEMLTPADYQAGD